MPVIKSSAELRNNYNQVSNLCHTYKEPVFITKNGKGDLAVLSIDTYEDIMARLELYEKIAKGIDDVKKGNVVSLVDFLDEINERRKK